MKWNIGMNNIPFSANFVRFSPFYGELNYKTVWFFLVYCSITFQIKFDTLKSFQKEYKFKVKQTN